MNPPDSPPDFLSKQVTSARRFYLNLKPRASPGLTVVCGGREDCAADFVIDRKTFPFFSMEFVAGGEGELFLAGKPHALSPGTIFAYGPGVPHRIRTAQEPRLVKYFVDFQGRPSLGFMRKAGLRPGRTIQVSNIGDVRAAFDSLISLGSQNDCETEKICALQLELLFRIIARSRQKLVASDRRSRPTFERVRQFLDTRFLEVSSVEEVANKCHINGSHLSRLLRRFQSESPRRYLQRRRMQWAADQLQGSDLLVREVADRLGMDPFHFSRAFKRVHGVSPSAFLDSRA